jgi:hypothetical protein
LKGGYLTERPGSSQDSPRAEAESRRVARANLGHASDFASFMHPSPFEMVAVSGSTSYGSASRSRDLDLYCVAPAGRLWLSLAHALIMARMFALLRRDSPKVCLSCVMDENYAEAAFASQRDALFARDALEAKVVKGAGFHRRMLGRASWIAEFYPHAYAALAATGPTPPRIHKRSVLDSVLNRFLFLTVGGFIRLKSKILNRRLVAAGRIDDLFTVRRGEDHLIYESSRYAEMRGEYRVVLPARTGFRS